MKNVFLLLGSNQGNRLQLLNQACKELQCIDLEIIKLSCVYESEPWGFVAEQNFLNQVVQLTTNLSPQELLKRTQQVENMLGRTRPVSAGYSSRTMDVDILFYGDEILNTSMLTIPHPRLHLRRFALVPLVEIAPGFVHPVFRKTMLELLEECEDEGRCEIFDA